MIRAQRRRAWVGVVLVGLAACAAPRGPDLVAPSPGVLVAHALGGVDGIAYTNSREAFERSWELGFRWFEVDLATTSDSVLVCFHDRHEAKLGLDVPVRRVTSQHFLERSYDGRYTLMTFADLLRAIAARPEAVLITDTKFITAGMMDRIDAAIDAVDPALRRQLVIQIYRPEDLDRVLDSEKRRGPFGGVVLTLYKTRMGDPEVIDFVERRGVRLITVNEKRFNATLARELHQRGGRVFVHTLNDPQVMGKLADWGADGFYTDFVAPPPTATGNLP